MIINLTQEHTDVQWYTQEKLIIRIEQSSYIELYVLNDKIARYYPSRGIIQFDVTDFMRTENTIVTFTIVNSSDYPIYTVRVTPSGRINPTGMLIPSHELNNESLPDSDRALIIPPKRMIVTYFGVVYAEFFSSNTGWESQWDDGPKSDIENGIILPKEWATYLRIYKNNQVVLNRRIQERECGTKYATVSWVSAAGIGDIKYASYRKLHTWKVASQKIEKYDYYSLLGIDNAFCPITGREDSILLYLDELDCYDIWYYSDIITSTEVRLLEFDSMKLDVGLYYSPVIEIVTKSITIPSGDRADGKIEFEAKIKRYDAVTL